MRKKEKEKGQIDREIKREFERDTQRYREKEIKSYFIQNIKERKRERQRKRDRGMCIYKHPVYQREGQREGEIEEKETKFSLYLTKCPGERVGSQV